VEMQCQGHGGSCLCNQWYTCDECTRYLPGFWDGMHGRGRASISYSSNYHYFQPERPPQNSVEFWSHGDCRHGIGRYAVGAANASVRHTSREVGRARRSGAPVVSVGPQKTHNRWTVSQLGVPAGNTWLGAPGGPTGRIFGDRWTASAAEGEGVRRGASLTAADRRCLWRDRHCHRRKGMAGATEVGWAGALGQSR